MPHRLAPNGLGVDHWYWKTYIESLRISKTFPPRLDQYLLDEHQWYPPVFPLMISILPDWFFEKYDYILAVLIDIVRMLLALSVAWFLTHNIYAVVVVGIIYAIFPILVSYNIQLNPRGLGALLLDIIGIVFVCSYPNGLLWWQLLSLAVLSGVILLTHKMTTQLYWFLSVSAFGATGDWFFLSLIPLSIVSAVIISKGFYIKVFKAHWDIVAFWNRNWKWLTAHPVLESPIYKANDSVSLTNYHRKGISGSLKRAQYILGFGPASWLGLVLVPLLWGGENTGEIKLLLFVWVAMILLFVLLTTIVPFMKCLGNGYLYLYNAALPTALLWCVYFPEDEISFMFLALISLSFFACLLVLFRYYKEVKTSKTIKIDDDLNNALVFLAEKREGTVMCLPFHWSEPVAYKTGLKVLWGAHGYGFKKLEVVWPRLMKPISDIIYEYDVKYLLTQKSYLPKQFLSELTEMELKIFGKVYLYKISNGDRKHL